MTILIFYIFFIAFLAFALLALNMLLAPHSPYKEKNGPYECGFDSFRGQNRSEFSISFFIFGLLFLLFDLEILLIFPYTVSSYNNGSYGLFFAIIFLLILTVGFIFEIGRGALQINSRQTGYLNQPNEFNNLKVKVSKETNLYQLRRFNSSLVLKRDYSTKSTNLPNKLNGYFVTGLVDGDGNLSISLIKSTSVKLGWSVKASLQIKLHNKDCKLLEAVQATLGGVGGIYDLNDGYSRYMVTSIKEIVEVVIPLFQKYPLITQKGADFELFQMAVNIIKNKEHLALDGLHKIVSIKAAMNKGLSDELKQKYPQVVPVLRSKVEGLIKDPNWLTGFVAAEGCFFIELSFENINGVKTPLKFKSLRLKITQHSRDEQLMKSIITYLGCGTYYLDTKRGIGDFLVRKFADIDSKIIPFFDKYPLYGSKSFEFADIKRAALIIKNKDHLKPEGLELLRQIKVGMNSGRYE